MIGYQEAERVSVRVDQRIEYIIARQDPVELGPDARDVVTKIAVRAGDILVVYRPALPGVAARVGPGTPGLK